MSEYGDIIHNCGIYFRTKGVVQGRETIVKKHRYASQIAHTACLCCTFSLRLILCFSCGCCGGDAVTGAASAGLVVIGARGELDVAAGTETVVCMEGEGVLVAEDGMASCCDISGGAASVSASPAG